jgi:predicted  nucleic acid-binding Zn-ribbon protein
MNQAINVWGPAFLVCLTVCLTVLIGVITNNKRIDDLRGEFLSINKRIDDVNKRMDDQHRDLTAQNVSLRSDLIARIDGLEKRLVDRLERLEHPVSRPYETTFPSTI